MISVTITGADNAVNPADMLRLSHKFPFVEWGILLSAQRMGMPRYPTLGWIAGLAYEPPMKVSAHLCGELARETARGHVVDVVPQLFHRCQINQYEAAFVAGLHRLAFDYPHVEFILQCRSVGTIQETANDANRIRRCSVSPAQELFMSASVLFDPSCGTGFEVFEWPVAPMNTKFGFAGGIRPDNVEPTIGSIFDANPWIDSFWIDTESGVRTDDRLDMGKVEDVLRKVAAINARLAG